MNDDLDEDIMDSDEGFDEFSQKSGIGNTVRQSAAAKVAIVLVVVGLIVGVLFMFGGETIEDKDSVVQLGSTVTSVPATDDEISPAYAEAVEQQNEEDLEIAIREGTSAIPVPIETPDMRLEMPEVEEESEDPLHRWRALQEERVERQMKTREAEVEPVTVLDAEQQSEAITQLSESMVEQMESILTNSTEDKVFTVKTLLTHEDQKNGSGGSGGSGGSASSNFVEDDTEEVIIPAGKIVYGQLLLEANSDVESVVLAQMVSGPLKGWKLLGEFEVQDDINLLSLTFNIAVNEDGKQYAVDAIMLDPDTTLAALRSDIDHRYMRRVVLPAAAAFVEGFAEAIAESGRTSVTVSGEVVAETEEEASSDQEVATGVTEAATEISEILDDMGDVEPLIIIAAGTPIGIFFTENVVDTEGDI